MADTKITNLGALTAAAGDEIPVNRAGADGKVTAAAIAALASASYGTGVSTALGINIGSNGAVVTQPAAFTGNSLKVLRVNAGETAFELAAAGSGSPGGSTTEIQFNDAGSFAGDSALTWDKTNNKIALAQGTITTSQPQIFSVTWNAAGVTFYGTRNQITSTASATLSRLETWEVGGSEVAGIVKDGSLFATNGIWQSAATSFNGAGYWGIAFASTSIDFYGNGTWLGRFNGANANLQVRSSGGIGFTSGEPNGTFDTYVSRVAAGIMGVRGAAGIGGAVSLIEQTAPSAPSTNGVYIYAEDNGAGKTRLMALFATGAAQQIAIEP